MTPVLLAAMCAGMVQVSADEPPRLRGVRIESSIRVDGALDEAEWRGTLPASDLRQREPREGAPASERTEVRVLYDGRALYIGIRAFDREPHKVIARTLQRDRLMQVGGDGTYRFVSDDGVAVILDPFGDRRSAFVFATNANGAEFDALITDENSAFNADWRGVWEVAARRTPDGWSAEFAIPFRTLRYPAGGARSAWGFNVQRTIRRRDEDALWSAWSRAEGGLHRVSRAGLLDGLEDLPRPPFNIEIKPYGLAGITQRVVTASSTADRTSDEWDAGLDAKWEIKPGLVLDATIRPDFAQVEADERIVNLTRFELFLPEKRDFFLENAGIFDFGTRGSFETPPFLMFFSRRIGISPLGEVPVLGGLRLTGRSGRQTLGVMSVLTQEAFGEPVTNFGVLRVKRDVGQRGYLGAMLTDRRASSDAHTDIGIDTSVWPTPRLNLQGFVARTTEQDGPSDVAFRGAAEYQGDPLFAFAEYLHIGPDAGTGMGFVTRTDARRTNTKVQYAFRPNALGIRRVDLYAGGKYLTRVDGREQDGNWFPGFSVQWESGENLSVTDVHGFTVLDGGFDLAGRIPVPPGRYRLANTVVSFNTSFRRAIAFVGQASLLDLFGGDLDTVGGTLHVRGGQHLAFIASYTRNDVRLPGGAFVAHVPGLRVTWTHTTRLSAAAYLQYESLSRRFSGNLRVNFIHRPGSDLYVVLNEERGDAADAWVLQSRALAIKLTYLVRF